MKNQSSKIFFNVSEVSEMTGLNKYDLAEMEIIFNEIKPLYFSSKRPTYQQKDIILINKFKEKYLETQKAKLEKCKVQQDEKPINRLVYENKIPIIAKRKRITSKKNWSRKYYYCVSCGTDESKHRGQGLCISCYEENANKKHINHIATKIYGDSARKLSMDNLIFLYHKKQMSLIDIAKTTNCTRQYVYKKLKEYGISLRDKSKARKIAMKEGKFKNLGNYTVNEEFFKAWSKEMAYVLGFIYADGCLFPGYKEKYSYCTVARIYMSQKEP